MREIFISPAKIVNIAENMSTWYQNGANGLDYLRNSSVCFGNDVFIEIAPQEK